MRANEAQYIAIDFETTGIFEEFDSVPWQLGMIFIDQGKLVPEYQLDQMLRVDRNRSFNPYAPGRHAALREELAQAPALPELWNSLSPWLTGRPLLAHNASVERNVLEESFPMHSFGPWIDTLTLSRAAWPNLPSYKLEELIPRLGLGIRLQELFPDRAPHDALYDAAACALLFEHILKQPGWSRATIEDLSKLRPSRKPRKK